GEARGRRGRLKTTAAARFRPWVLGLLRGHGDVPVQGRAVLDREPAHLDVTVEVSGPAEGQAASRGHVSVDLAADADVRALYRGLDVGGAVHRHVAAGLELTLDRAGDLEVALDLQASMQAVARAEVDDVRATVLGACASVGPGLLSLGHLGVLHWVDRAFP